MPSPYYLRHIVFVVEIKTFAIIRCSFILRIAIVRFSTSDNSHFSSECVFIPRFHDQVISILPITWRCRNHETMCVRVFALLVTLNSFKIESPAYAYHKSINCATVCVRRSCKVSCLRALMLRKPLYRIISYNRRCLLFRGWVLRKNKNGSAGVVMHLGHK